MIDKVKIENAAIEIYSKHFKKGIPAEKLPKIIAKEGIVLKEADCGEKFLGVFTKSPQNTPCIVINSRISNIGRKNFTLAHELGHFVLQHYLHTVSFICSESEISEENREVSLQEKEANYFASCFLLPKDKVVREFTNWFRFRINPNSRVFLNIDLSNGKSFSNWKAISSNLEKKYCVSTAALKIRLVNLGLINNFS